VAGLRGDAPGLEGVDLDDGSVHAVDALFVASRTRMTSGLGTTLGCEVEEGPFGPVVRTDARKATSVPGVFAAGDAARVPHNATLAAADGVLAGTSAHQSLVFP
jgi:thioredoxin reductase